MLRLGGRPGVGGRLPIKLLFPAGDTERRVIGNFCTLKNRHRPSHRSFPTAFHRRELWSFVSADLSSWLIDHLIKASERSGYLIPAQQMGTLNSQFFSCGADFLAAIQNYPFPFLSGDENHVETITQSGSAKIIRCKHQMLSDTCELVRQSVLIRR